jgi:hypothetical protein
MSFTEKFISLVPCGNRARNYLRSLLNSPQFTFILSLITFGILLWYKIIMCTKAKEPVKVFLLLNSLMCSDIKIISPRYIKDGGKLMPLANLGMRITRKFVNIIVSKTVLMREIPKARHFSYFSLLIVHFLAFSLYYRAVEMKNKEVLRELKSKNANGEQQTLMVPKIKNKSFIRKLATNKVRIIVQMTF